MIKKITETREERETLYEEIVIVDAIAEDGKPVRIRDSGKNRFTESQVDAQIIRTQAQLTRLQAQKDGIVAIKEAE